MLCLAYIVAADEAEADELTEHLLNERLVACVNSFPIRSRYWWEGKIESETEVVMIAKTRDELKERIIKAVRDLHSYDVPAIDFIPIQSSYPELDEWVVNETTKKE